MCAGHTDRQRFVEICERQDETSESLCGLMWRHLKDILYEKRNMQINFVSILQGNLQIQFNPYQDTDNGIFHRPRVNYSNTGMET